VRHRPANPLLAALLCLGALMVTGAVALILPAARAHDSATLQGFAVLSGHTRISQLANLLVHSVDPPQYAIAAAVLVVAAILRGRPRVALAVPLAMFAASATTELLKPLVGHPRSSEWLGGGGLTSIESWPSGHATAAMMAALCAVLVAPPVLRPLTALLGTGLAVGVSYSILVLGWHFPSDVLGGFLVAGGWVSLALAALWSAEARWPERSGRRALERVAATTSGSGLLAPAALLAASFGAAVAVLGVRGRLVETYGAAHLSFVAGALAIAGLAAVLATAMAVALRR
jgi:membrane-associated phospholipid phosphatase